MDILAQLTQEFSVRPKQVQAVMDLLEDGKTVPFIARYRKEMTGALDDQTIRQMEIRLQALRSLAQRKLEIHNAIEGKGKLTDEIIAALEKATTLVELEDIYRPYKEKRKTRGSVARERGLEPLAEKILVQYPKGNPEEWAESFVDEEQSLPDVPAVLQGAMDIIAEDISDNADIRLQLRKLYQRGGTLTCQLITEDEASVYHNYKDFSSPVRKLAGHQILAIQRGERDEALKVTIGVTENSAEQVCERRYLKNNSPSGMLVKEAIADSIKRLLAPSIVREVRAELFASACENAIRVFGANLKQLLMQPPLKHTVTLGFDPAYRTGCKLAVVDGFGKVLDTGVVYPTPPQKKVEEAARKIRDWVERYQITAIAIGNGTASRESESFVADLLESLPHKVSYMVVSEAGASVYSASELAAKEFPDFDVAIRSAVSIARRLQDPLAELVKIDPKAIGVGQYQHDMPKHDLQTALDGVVEECVNAVGVDVNTASPSLLSHISGINQTVAKNIVAYREENGAFLTRLELLNVPKLGPKAFEQSAGFLRITDGNQPLDATSVHPESYKAAQSLLHKFNFTLADITSGKLDSICSKMEQYGFSKLADELDIGDYTLRDIGLELQKPGRDPRDLLPPPLLRSSAIMELSDLKPGMQLVGTVRNVVDFGCFVDIGVHEDGLVHISQISNTFIRHPLEAVSVGDVVTVWVLDVDCKRKRISLTMKG